MNTKVALKGFSHLHFTLVDADTPDNYLTEVASVALPGASQLSREDARSEFSIPADDGVYDSGATWQETTLKITVRQMELAHLATLLGATLTADGKLLESGNDVPPVVAITFAALRLDGGYRCFAYYHCKCTGASVSNSTNAKDKTAVDDYELSFICSARALDGIVRATCDLARSENPLDWLTGDAFAQIP